MIIFSAAKITLVSEKVQVVGRLYDGVALRTAGSVRDALIQEIAGKWAEWCSGSSWLYFAAQTSVMAISTAHEGGAEVAARRLDFVSEPRSGHAVRVQPSATGLREIGLSVQFGTGPELSVLIRLG
jgi:hypothetical protein